MIRAAQSDAFDATGQLPIRKTRPLPRDECDLVSGGGEFLRKSMPDFFGRVADDRRRWQKKARDDRDFHVRRAPPVDATHGDVTLCLSATNFTDKKITRGVGYELVPVTGKEI